MIDLTGLIDHVKIEMWNDGKLHVTVDSSIVVHIRGDEHKIVDGTSVLSSGIDIVEISGRHHHVNPSGADFYDTVMADAAADSNLRALMERRHVAYSIADKEYARRRFYKSAAVNNMLRKKPGGHGCGCK